MGRGKVLSEFESKNFLREAKISVCKEKIVNNIMELKNVLEELGFPVAIKGCMEGLAHKSEQNLVFLHVKSIDEAEKIYQDIKNKIPEAQILVQEMVDNRREVVVGFIRDKIMGPCVMFGLGGIFTEILKDVTFRLAPITKDEALEMLEDIKGKKILESVRGLPPVNKDALADIVVKISQLGSSNEKIKEIDINPICFNKKGLPVVVDSSIIVE